MAGDEVSWRHLALSRCAFPGCSSFCTRPAHLVIGSNMASDDTLYCVCRQPYDGGRFMIECDVCKDWFHGR